MSTILVTIAVTTVGLVFLGVLGVIGYFAVRWRKQQMDVQLKFIVAVDKLADVAEILSNVPKFIEGHAKAAHALATEVAKLNKAIQAFSGLIMNPKDSERPQIQVPDEQEESEAWNIMQLLEENPGMSMDEAKDRAGTYLTQMGVE